MVAGRLREGVTREQANADCGSVFQAYVATLPNANFEGQFSPVFVPYQESLARPVRPALLVMHRRSERRAPWRPRHFR